MQTTGHTDKEMRKTRLPQEVKGAQMKHGWVPKQVQPCCCTPITFQLPHFFSLQQYTLAVGARPPSTKLCQTPYCMKRSKRTNQI
eukprot:796783-Pelagomonas_calceolata.AAC.1